MKKVQTDFQDEEQLPAQYEKAIGNNDEQYFKDKYLSGNQNTLAVSLKTLQNCIFKREVQSNGDIFVGYYKEDQINGFDQSKSYSKFYGRLYEKQSFKEGYLRNGLFHGGVCQYGVNTKGDNYYYDGDYVDGIPNGYGVIMSHGSMYCGEYKNGIIHGLGTYYYNDGDSYKGQWMNNMQHGEGVFKYTNGSILKGTWKDGDKHGEFNRTYASGKQEKIIYDMDEIILCEEIKST
eukprot:403364353